MKHGKKYRKSIVDSVKKLIGIVNCTANEFAEMQLSRESRRGKCLVQI